jgi:hypothetical protein
VQQTNAAMREEELCYQKSIGFTPASIFLEKQYAVEHEQSVRRFI